MSESEHGFPTIAGGWLGTYAYRGRAAHQHPVRFEGTFSVSADGKRFTGTILDDDSLGEAGVVGKQDGLVVRFTKVYIHAPRDGDTGPVQYEGTLAEDGRTMSGVWTLPLPGRSPLNGVWDAHRMWHEEASEEAVPDEREEFATAGRPLWI